MLDLLIHNATLPDGRSQMSVAVQDGRIVEVTPGLQASAAQVDSQARPWATTAQAELQAEAQTAMNLRQAEIQTESRDQ